MGWHHSGVVAVERQTPCSISYGFVDAAFGVLAGVVDLCSQTQSNNLYRNKENIAKKIHSETMPKLLSARR